MTSDGDTVLRSTAGRLYGAGDWRLAVLALAILIIVLCLSASGPVRWRLYRAVGLAQRRPTVLQKASDAQSPFLDGFPVPLGKKRETLLLKGGAETATLQRIFETSDSLKAARLSTDAYIRRHGLMTKTEKPGSVVISDGISKSVAFDSSTSAGLTVTASEEFALEQP